MMKPEHKFWLLFWAAVIVGFLAFCQIVASCEKVKSDNFAKCAQQPHTTCID